MKIYHYHKETKEYLGQSNANLDPLETKRTGKKVYAVPANSTLSKPAIKADKMPVRDGDKWVNKLDKRGAKYFLPGDTTEYTMGVLGDDLPAGHLDAMDSVAEDAQNAAGTSLKEEIAYNACYAFQLENIDMNLSNEMTKAESLVEAGKATEADLPLAKANGEWLQKLWDFHDREVLNLRAGDAHSLDFLGEVGALPHGFKAVRGERKSFLADL